MKVATILGIALVPGVLALGALYWLLFAENTHDFGRRLDREKRDALAVHAVPAPTRTIQIIGKKLTGLSVESADQDGSRIVAYVRNTSHVCIPYAELHYKMVAPDGTVIASNSVYQNDTSAGISPGERLEMSINNVPEDNRAATIKVWASGAAELQCDH